jgi:hypothetical protein
LHVLEFKYTVLARAGGAVVDGEAPGPEKGTTMEILVALVVITGVGLGYRYWRARSAH